MLRFVSPETTRIDLQDNQWIEIKKDLTVGEDKSYRTAGFKRMSQSTDKSGDQRQEIDIDWQALAFARVSAYLLDWSAKDAKDKSIPVSDAAIRNLEQDSFEEIDNAIQAHIQARDEEKKAKSSPREVAKLSA